MNGALFVSVAGKLRPLQASDVGRGCLCPPDVSISWAADGRGSDATGSSFTTTAATSTPPSFTAGADPGLSPTAPLQPCVSGVVLAAAGDCSPGCAAGQSTAQAPCPAAQPGPSSSGGCCSRLD